MLFFRKKQKKQQILQPRADLIKTELELHFIFHIESLMLEQDNSDQVVNTNKENKTIKAKFKNVVKLNENDDKHLEQVINKKEQLIKEANENDFNDFTKERKDKLLANFIDGDLLYERRLNFVIKYVLSIDPIVKDNTKKQLFKQFSLELGLPSENTISEVYSSLKKNYININLDKDLNKKYALNAGIIAGLLAGGVATMIVVPVLSVPGIKIGTILAGTLLTATTVASITTGVTTGVIYQILNYEDGKALINELSELTPSELTHFLTVNLTIIEYMFKFGAVREDAALVNRLNVFINLDNEISKKYYLYDQSIDSLTKKQIVKNCDVSLLKLFKSYY